jgi:formate-dependent nitrite reductase membrane component NrfD
MTELTREGQVGVRPGREAQIGAHGTTQRFGGGGRRRKGRGRKGEQLMVPDAQPVNYYGKPVLNRPVWSARDIGGYLFTGGLAGASSVVAAGAAFTGRDHLARSAKVTALGAITVSAGLLVHDLGRPERFYNMLRVFKPTSPMSVGSWFLAAYGPAAGIAALTDVSGFFPRIGAAATVAAAGLGPLVASYTGVLIADTAVPAWHDSYRELPFVFVGSAAVAASGLGLVAAPVRENLPVRRAAVAGALLELAASHRMEGRGLVAEPFHEGTAGSLLKAAKALTVGGVVTGATLGGRSRVAAVASGAAMLGASALTRFGVFQAGMQSADDPKYVLEPQRERADQSAKQG